MTQNQDQTLPPLTRLRCATTLAAVRRGERDTAAVADARGDPERSARAQAERDTLIRGLSAATGLSGRSRRLGEGSERARKAVTMRIKDALRRIDGCHPTLGWHLREAISTGTVCAYRPTEPVRWTL